MRSRQARPQGGFTLVELVMVIVLIGVLAALAVPRLIGMGSDARVATIRQVEGVVRTTAELTHQAWVLRGNGNLGWLTLSMADGSQVSMWYGYPDGGDCCQPAGTGVEAALSSYGLTVVYLDNERTRWQIDSAPTPAACSVTYAEASSATSGYSLVADTGGC